MNKTYTPYTIEDTAAVAWQKHTDKSDMDQVFDEVALTAIKVNFIQGWVEGYRYRHNIHYHEPIKLKEEI